MKLFCMGMATSVMTVVEFVPQLSELQSLKEWCIPPDFLIYVLVCTAQSTKCMKINYIPLKSPMKLQQEMQKKIWNLPKFVQSLGHFLKKQRFWKMGMAGIKQLLRPSQIASFLRNLNGEAFLKVSFQNVDWFQKYNALKLKIVKRVQFHKENGIKKEFSTSKLCISESSQHFGMKLSGRLPH